VTTGSQAVNARAPSQVRRLVLAVTFLTGLPVPLHGDADEADLWGSMGWYPLVGLGLGSVGWLLYAGSLWLVTPAVAAVLTVALLELATRALHLDGLMDTCDGYFSGRSRERALEIMKDSRVGAMGVVGALAVVLLKVTALASLGRHGAVVPLLVGWTAARTHPSTCGPSATLATRVRGRPSLAAAPRDRSSWPRRPASPPLSSLARLSPAPPAPQEPCCSSVPRWASRCSRRWAWGAGSAA